MATILVTGGAGFIGSVAVKTLLSNGYSVVVVDNLSKGKKDLVDSKAKFYELDLVDDLSKVFEENKIDAVIHFAAYKAVEESMENAVKYSSNITGTINLLNRMVEHNVKKIIFSSSAAVYGEEKGVISEDNETNPCNYYGFTKLECEKIIEWYGKVYGIGYVSLRYFNVAGDGGLKYMDPDAKNIFPIIMEVLVGKREKVVVFGNDYDTRDGTCIRDYIDVTDLVKAHILALDVDYNGVINLGTSKGVSVKELVDWTSEVIGKQVPFEYGDRRAGDPPTLIASNEKALKVLNWKPERSVKDMIKSTYDAYKQRV
ncbi:MAG: UDP-glucose 4-epimerase GalE [Nanoarchaeota archaeon]|nr:UDP-glucose 4-epimerase GalE [DPANN group archaeon]MBL7116268.1 UDP-glucose 4-epimerase GalE [Nanoarchaeota archaeon]